MALGLERSQSSAWVIGWLSVLGLYLELLLIRWIGTEVRIFAYLQNTILVVCFLGLGAGLLSSRRPKDLTRMLAALTALVVLLAIPFTRDRFADITRALSVLGDLNIWHSLKLVDKRQVPAVVGLALLRTLILLALVLETFVPIGRWLGEMLERAPSALRAYSVNVAGSLAGTLLFVAISVAALPPWVWFVVLALLLLPLLRFGKARHAPMVAAIGLAPLAAAFLGSAPVTIWSPYQKLELWRPPAHVQGSQAFWITVNNTPYQAMYDLSSARVAAHPEIYPPEQAGLSQYDLPLLLHPRPDRVLVVGAGSGNDVAGALRHGAKHVTAVEIDPAILALGRAHHPERPYDDPRVSVVNDDARAFFATTKQRFDVVIFGLLDSHTTAAMTNARLDHYVYTQQSMDRVRGLIAPGGIAFLSFEAFKPFLRDRIANTLARSFGAAPLAFRVPPSAYGWGGVMFVTGDARTVRSQLAAQPRLAAAIAGWQANSKLGLTGTIQPATDDWPYLYLPRPTIPPLYGLLALLLAVLVVYVRRAFGLSDTLSVKAWGRSELHFAALGAAFLLLEVQNISKAAVALGNTWNVNAVIISGVLCMVLLANTLTPHLRAVPTFAVYAALLSVVAFLYVLDLASLAFLPYVIKCLLVGVLTALPMLFGGVVFARSFAAAGHRDRALGANLLGSVFGAMLQTASFLVGIRALLLLVALLYLASWIAPPQPFARLAGSHGEPSQG